MTAEDDVRHLLLSLLRGFYWFDEGLQNYLQARGWPVVTRPQSMVMANLVLGVRRPSDIARNMGVSRQAIHATINQMIAMDIVQLVDDPTNGRVKIVAPTKMGETMRVDAQRSMIFMGEELARRLGKAQFLKAAHLLAEDWGPPVTFTPADVANDA
ncbi:MAG: MarR family winged helix-turn-helix transcriptional regulator [Alphaproteobacteria bacterium]|nr:MarR family winged helix-turn-helix transcriptional regulator [Alphaproteobacteria bacterium]MBU1516094.1 MarR family winged helix-turn-helix transcriptional regulator [Alphaproteobacteria bacterium]MBU2092691.1 MarR family winged helix-turn-helix transcriptional regulator [Alphaproteobacteria bacterium]MBU2153784.1 MarR family winged helix-turn-helix transcriptional regulator [Alphaproteobacteria bacterium]MBU2308412.1 MarR family winged helix-turn-helix transcriptional regulator [Alphaprot